MAEEDNTIDEEVFMDDSSMALDDSNKDSPEEYKTVNIIPFITIFEI